MWVEAFIEDFPMVAYPVKPTAPRMIEGLPAADIIALATDEETACEIAGWLYEGYRQMVRQHARRMGRKWVQPKVGSHLLRIVDATDVADVRGFLIFWPVWAGRQQNAVRQPILASLRAAFRRPGVTVARI
jgi:hypothetical protein